jgi:hypothetical protein
MSGVFYIMEYHVSSDCGISHLQVTAVKVVLLSALFLIAKSLPLQYLINHVIESVFCYSILIALKTSIFVIYSM